MLSLRPAEPARSDLARELGRRRAVVLLRRLPRGRADHSRRRTRRVLSPLRRLARRSAAWNWRSGIGIGRCGGRSGWPRPAPGRRTTRDLAAARRHSLPGMHLAQRNLSAAPTGRARCADQFRHAPSPCPVGLPADAIVLAPAGGRRHRLPRASVRSGTPRSGGAQGGTGAARAHGARAAGDDASHDVRDSGLHQRRRGGAGVPAPAQLGELRPDLAGGAVFGGTVLRRCAARSSGAPAGHGPASGAGRGRRVRRQRVGNAARLGGGLLRLGHHVRGAPARRPLRRAAGAATGGRRHRGDQRRSAGDRRTPAALPGFALGRKRRRRGTAGRRLHPGCLGRHRPRGRRSHRRPIQRRRGAVDRGELAAQQTTRRQRACRLDQSRKPVAGAGHGGGRGDHAGGAVAAR